MLSGDAAGPGGWGELGEVPGVWVENSGLVARRWHLQCLFLPEQPTSPNPHLEN